MKGALFGMALALLILVGFQALSLNAFPVAAQDPVVDVAITALAPNKRIVGRPMNMRINITLQNEGDEEINVNATIHVNGTRVGDINNVTLPSGGSETVTIVWRATVEMGNYTITANVTILAREIDVADNTFTGGWLFVTLPGDVDGNRRIDIFDIVRLAMAYGASDPWDPRYDPYCDIDDSGSINIFDIVYAEYGFHW